MKVSVWFLLAAFLVGIAATVLYFMYLYTPSETSIIPRRNTDLITVALPNDPDPDVFGPRYWEMYHKITNNIPCPSCRNKAVPFMEFFHDVVNNKTGKKIFNQENFNNHIDNISKLPKA